MLLENIKKIGIIGGGTMGCGIAQVCSLAGFNVIVFDSNPEAMAKGIHNIKTNLDKAVSLGKLTQGLAEQTQKRIQFTEFIMELKAEFIIEAIVEKLDAKRNVFSVLVDINPEDTIMATNTSSIPITQIAFNMPNPERFVGMHFFNPAHLMKLVEVIQGASTAMEVVELTVELTKVLGKTPVIAKDSAGFIVNRVARPYYVEGLKILEEGVADIHQIDSLMESLGFKMGPFKLMDLIGVDTNFSVTSSMYEQFFYDSKFRPSRIQKQKVDAGHWGIKSGKGFYDYNN